LSARSFSTSSRNVTSDTPRTVAHVRVTRAHADRVIQAHPPTRDAAAHVRVPDGMVIYALTVYGESLGPG
jgi:hypothetical protein